MHRITDKRFTGTDRRILDIFNAICGENLAPHIVLCSTMWNTLPKAVAAAEAAVREQDLCESTQFWAPLIDQGAKYMRFTGDEDSGRAIIEHILSHPANRPMGIQTELCNTNCTLQDTTAGQLIEAEARKGEDRLRQEHQEEEAELRERKRDLEAEVHRLERCELQQRRGDSSAGRIAERRFYAPQNARAGHFNNRLVSGILQLLEYFGSQGPGDARERSGGVESESRTRNV